MTEIKYDLLVVTGLTATGKTSLAVNLAKELNGEIISADSRQVFRGMSIGTGKDLDDYVIDGQKIPYHLIDIKDAGETYSVFQFQQDFLKAYEDIKARKNFPVLSGGTGLYVESVVSRYKLLDVPQNANLRAELKSKSLEDLTQMLSEMKQLHNTTDVDTKQRAIRAIEIARYYEDHNVEETEMPNIKPLIVAPSYDRPQVRKRITERLHQRLEEGMVEETKKLLDRGVDPEKLISYGLEYKYLTWYLTGEMDYDTMVERLNIAIHQFAKRQMTWFRRMQRKGVEIHWIDGYLPMAAKVDNVVRLLKS
ncbi:tRNA dimethylallyltransferase [Salinivirga cyanobacteriivorans]|uniref:tRNA dimethylallyltransferase n=1 Tax=Salinivirga cyanobacteriivorans TaxID=1307839 RepID=A0A0S2HWB1_9BACT|nr:tRNA (adenosine(37)-N6)-dimethylallyltransferase MiaA [Salinivirga cyanobacteriivorans]ALO14277.1 tRNA dimethylallyltransferase [Salinivirga cyanobacteriivorans]